MKNKLIRIAKDTNLFLKKFIKKQKRTELVDSHGVWFIPRRKKN